MQVIAEAEVVLETGCSVSPRLARKWHQREPMKQEEVAVCMGLTRTTVCRIEAHALAKIKKCLEEADLRPAKPE